MDLKEINGFEILHLIDHATSYSAATIVKSKQKQEIVKKQFLKYGLPCSVLPLKF